MLRYVRLQAVRVVVHRSVDVEQSLVVIVFVDVTESDVRFAEHRCSGALIGQPNLVVTQTPRLNVGDDHRVVNCPVDGRPVDKDKVALFDQLVIHELGERVVGDVLEVQATIGRLVVASVLIQLVGSREGRPARGVADEVPFVVAATDVDVVVRSLAVDVRRAVGLHQPGHEDLTREVRAVAAEQGVIVVERILPTTAAVGHVVVGQRVVDRVDRIVYLVGVGECRDHRESQEHRRSLLLSQIIPTGLSNEAVGYLKCLQESIFNIAEIHCS